MKLFEYKCIYTQQNIARGREGTKNILFNIACKSTAVNGNALKTAFHDAVCEVAHIITHIFKQFILF